MPFIVETELFWEISHENAANWSKFILKQNENNQKEYFVRRLDKKNNTWIETFLNTDSSIQGFIGNTAVCFYFDGRQIYRYLQKNDGTISNSRYIFSNDELTLVPISQSALPPFSPTFYQAHSKLSELKDIFIGKEKEEYVAFLLPYHPLDLWQRTQIWAVIQYYLEDLEKLKIQEKTKVEYCLSILHILTGSKVHKDIVYSPDTKSNIKDFRGLLISGQLKKFPSNGFYSLTKNNVTLADIYYFVMDCLAKELKQFNIDVSISEMMEPHVEWCKQSVGEDAPNHYPTSSPHDSDLMALIRSYIFSDPLFLEYIRIHYVQTRDCFEYIHRLIPNHSLLKEATSGLPEILSADGLHANIQNSADRQEAIDASYLGGILKFRTEWRSLHFLFSLKFLDIEEIRMIDNFNETLSLTQESFVVHFLSTQKFLLMSEIFPSTFIEYFVTEKSKEKAKFQIKIDIDSLMKLTEPFFMDDRHNETRQMLLLFLRAIPSKKYVYFCRGIKFYWLKKPSLLLEKTASFLKTSLDNKEEEKFLNRLVLLCNEHPKILDFFQILRLTSKLIGIEPSKIIRKFQSPQRLNIINTTYHSRKPILWHVLKNNRPALLKKILTLLPEDNRLDALTMTEGGSSFKLKLELSKLLKCHANARHKEHSTSQFLRDILNLLPDKHSAIRWLLKDAINSQDILILLDLLNEEERYEYLVEEWFGVEVLPYLAILFCKKDFSFLEPILTFIGPVLSSHIELFTNDDGAYEALKELLRVVMKQPSQGFTLFWGLLSNSAKENVSRFFLSESGLISVIYPESLLQLLPFLVAISGRMSFHLITDYLQVIKREVTNISIGPGENFQDIVNHHLQNDREGLLPKFLEALPPNNKLSFLKIFLYPAESLLTWIPCLSYNKVEDCFLEDYTRFIIYLHWHYGSEIFPKEKNTFPPKSKKRFSIFSKNEERLISSFLWSLDGFSYPEAKVRLVVYLTEKKNKSFIEKMLSDLNLKMDEFPASWNIDRDTYRFYEKMIKLMKHVQNKHIIFPGLFEMLQDCAQIYFLSKRENSDKERFKMNCKSILESTEKLIKHEHIQILLKQLLKITSEITESVDCHAQEDYMWQKNYSN